MAASWSRPERSPRAWRLAAGSGGEPWAFTLDRDGTIAARWDNLLALPELDDGLETVVKGE